MNTTTESAAWTVRTTLNWMMNRFKEFGAATPLLDAQLLLVDVLKIPKIKLYTDLDRPLSDAERGELRVLVKRRLNGEPLAYLTKQKVWHDLDLFVDNRVLIPRPETETLLDFVLGYLKEANQTPQLIFDFCTGSGCLAIALAKRCPGAVVVAIDISQDALEVAKLNAERNGVVENIRFVCADVTTDACYKTLSEEFGKPDVIVANPPYVSEEEWQALDIDVRDFEPKISLVADEDGLAVSRRLLEKIADAGWLHGLQCLGIEMGEGHPQRVQNSELSNVPFRSGATAFPKEAFFAMRDLEERERFLCWVARSQIL